MSSCCTPDGSCSTSAASESATVVADSNRTVYAVTGMTCGHCKSTLSAAIGELESVVGVDVDIETGRVTVTTAGVPDDTLIAKAVDDAGYELTGRA